MITLRKLIRQRQREIESFKARIVMEQQAQERTEARLTEIELRYKNMVRMQ